MSKAIQFKKGTENAYVKSRTLLYDGIAGVGATIYLTDEIKKYNYIIVYTGTSNSDETFTGGLLGAVGFNNDIFCNKIWSPASGKKAYSQLHFLGLRINNPQQVTIFANYYCNVSGLQTGEGTDAYIHKIYGCM